MNNHALISLASTFLADSGAYRLFTNRYAGLGSILMFHRVLPDASASVDFAPNAGQVVGTQFFESVIQELVRSRYDLVTISEAKRRLDVGASGRRFVCISFDDGYRDNFEHAYPICRRYGVPMTIFLVTGFLDRTWVMWWLALERLIATQTEVEVPFRGQLIRLRCSDSQEKAAAFKTLGGAFGTATAAEQQRLIDVLSERYSLDLREVSAANAMTWEMVREMEESGGVEFGAHTVSHYSLARLPVDHARTEMVESRRQLVERLSHPILHFAYPFGGRADAGLREFRMARELGFATGLTTRHGTVMPEHVRYPHCLPRISMNGHHQNVDALRVYLSGASAALMNRFAQLVTD
jgi:peptidoglycan/xylan/chitin deacetylase (PgdA/CDA1 family)